MTLTPERNGIGDRARSTLKVATTLPSTHGQTSRCTKNLA